MDHLRALVSLLSVSTVASLAFLLTLCGGDWKRRRLIRRCAEAEAVLRSCGRTYVIEPAWVQRFIRRLAHSTALETCVGAYWPPYFNSLLHSSVSDLRNAAAGSGGYPFRL